MTPESTPGSGRRTPDLWLALAVALFALASVLEFARNTIGIDYYLYWATGMAVQRGEIRDVYDQAENERVGALYFQAAQQEARQRGAREQGTRRLAAATVRKSLDNFSTPLLYALYGFALSGDYERDFNAVQTFSTLLFAAGLWLLTRRLGYSTAASALALALCTMLAGPFIDDASVGNVNRVQVGLLGLSAWLATLRRGAASDLATGLVLGLTVLFKPNLWFCVATLTTAWVAAGAARRIVALGIGGALALALSLGLSAAWFGSLDPWFAWPKRLGALMPQWAGEMGNQSLARVLHDRVGLSAADWMPATFLCIVCGAFAAGRWLRSTDLRVQRDDSPAQLEVLALALGAAASVLSTKLAWFHYYLLLAPLALWLMRPGHASRAQLALAALAFVVTMTDIPRKLLPQAAFDASLALNLGACALFALGLVAAARAVASARSSTPAAAHPS